MRRVALRMGSAIFVLWATISLAFVVSSVLPSDPARMVAGPQARPEEVERIRKLLALDRPIYAQYTHFWRRLVHTQRATDGPSDHASCEPIFGSWHVDLGTSYQQRAPVVSILKERFPRTLLLAVAASIVQLGLGIAAGTLAASKKHLAIDRLVVSGSVLGISAPTFVIGLFFQWILAFRLRLFPLDGFGQTAGEHLASLVLPALTLGVFGAAYYTRLVRDELLIELRRDYVRTARAKGLSPGGAVVRHALRNALLPIVTIAGMELGALVSGAIVTETIFRWPGIGALSVSAMIDRDGPVLMGCVIVTAVATVGMTLLVDLVYPLVDPRLRERS